MKPTRFGLLLVVLLVLVAAAPAAAPAPAAAHPSSQEVTLTVHVTDNFGTDIKDATVTVRWEGGEGSDETRANGQALIDVPEGADVTIRIEHQAYTRNHPVTVQDVGDGEEVTIKVFRKASANVKVVNEDGSPVEGARVTLFKQGNRGNPAADGRTDSDGVFATGTIEKSVQGDPYHVLVLKAGFLRNETTVQVEGTTEFTVAIEQETVTVDVTVVDDHFDPPKKVEGATVRYEGLTTGTLQTGGSGTTTIGLPVNARFTITVTKDGYTTASRQVSIGEQPRSLEFAISREPTLQLTAVNQRIVAGERVQLEVTNEYGNPVEGAAILVDGEVVGETNAEGVYRATLETEGTHTITARTGDLTSSEVTVEAISADEGTPRRTPAGTPTATPPGELPGFDSPGFAVQIGVAAAGVLLAYLIVRRLL